MAQLQPTTVQGVLNSLREENTKTSSHTLDLDDRDKLVTFNNSSAANVTVPADSSTDFPVGSIIYIGKIGSGDLTLAGASGVTLSKSGKFGDNEYITVVKRSANNWVVFDANYNPDVSGGTETTDGSIGISSFTSTGSDTLNIG